MQSSATTQTVTGGATTSSFTTTSTGQQHLPIASATPPAATSSTHISAPSEVQPSTAISDRPKAKSGKKDGKIRKTATNLQQNQMVRIVLPIGMSSSWHRCRDEYFSEIFLSSYFAAISSQL